MSTAPARDPRAKRTRNTRAKSTVRLRRVLDACKIARAESAVPKRRRLNRRPPPRSIFGPERSDAKRDCSVMLGYYVTCKSYGGGRAARVAKPRDKVVPGLAVFRREQLSARKKSGGPIVDHSRFDTDAFFPDQAIAKYLQRTSCPPLYNSFHQL